MAQVPQVLLQLAATGVHISVDAWQLAPMLMMQLAETAKRSGGTVTFRNCGFKAPQVLLQIAQVAPRNVVLEL